MSQAGPGAALREKNEEKEENLKAARITDGKKPKGGGESTYEQVKEAYTTGMGT